MQEEQDAEKLGEFGRHGYGRMRWLIRRVKCFKPQHCARNQSEAGEQELKTLAVCGSEV